MRRSAVAAAALSAALLTPPADARRPDLQEDRAEAARPIRFAEPGPEMRKLAWLIGAWEFSETWAEPRRYKRGRYEGYPAEGGYGTLDCRLRPGEFSIVCDYAAKNPMGRVTALEILSWEPVRRLYVLDTVHSAFPGVLRLTGRFEGGALVFMGEDASRGEKETVRLVFRDPAPDSWTRTLEASSRVGSKRPVVTLKARKKAPAP